MLTPDAGYISFNQPHILFVGTSPTEEDYITRKPFSGEVGISFRTLVDIALSPYPTVQYTLTNAIYCTPFTDQDLDASRVPFLSEIKACGKHLGSLIDLLKPEHIITLGKHATKAVKLLQRTSTEILTADAILYSSHSDLEQQRAILTIQRIAKDISSGKESR